jgi:hypothetical protein
MAPSDSKRALVNVVFVDDNRYNPRSHRDSEKLRALAAKYCAMSDDARLDALIPVIEDTVVMLALNNGELREKITNWLKPGVPGDVPPEVIGALIDALNIGRRSASRALKHIYVTRRAYILDKLRPVISTSSQGEQEIKDADQGTADTRQQATAIIGTKSAEGSEVKDAKAVGKESAVKEEGGEGGRQLAAIPCAEASKTELIYDIFRELGISLDERGAEVGYLLCADFTKHELEAILKRVKSIKSLPSNEQGERLGEVRRLLFSLDEDEIRAYFGLAVAEPGEAEGGATNPPEVEAYRDALKGAREASEDFVNAMRALGDAERSGNAELMRKAWEGAENSLARFLEAGLRARLGDGRSLRDTSVRLAKLVMILMRYPGILKALGEVLETSNKGDRLGELAELLDVAKVVLVKCGRRCDWVLGLLINSPERLEEVRGLLMARSDAELAYELCTRLRTALAGLRMHDEGASLEGICEKLGNLADQAP